MAEKKKRKSKRVHLDGSKMGRPTKRNEDRLDTIAKALEYGLGEREACALAGINGSTLTRWKQKDEGLRIRLDEARATFVYSCAVELHKAISNGTLSAVFFGLKSHSEAFREVSSLEIQTDVEPDRRYI